MMRDQDSDTASAVTEIGREVSARLTPYEPNQNGRVYHVSTPNRHETILFENSEPIIANFMSANLKRSMGDVYIDGRKFDPQPDMSPIEASWISILMSYATMTVWNNWDFEPFIHEHKLDRHFMPKEE